ncbi:MAG: hypothetical protein HY680_00550, partial [Chloroflexi bacterium]|nr:hypothetical protein [Chloroflexota bacterium]
MKRTGSTPEVPSTGGLKEESPAFAGAGLLAELSRHSGTPAAERVLPKKRSPRGPQPWERVESCVLLSAPGGAC